MKSLRQYWRIMTLLLGIGLIGAGIFAAYWWYHRVAPYRKMYDSTWCREHSALAYWEAFRSLYDRHEWPHDAFSVAKPGDKVFLATLISRIKPGDEIGECDFGHLDVLFPYITNQKPGVGADAWLAWWKTNQAKSQVEWIRDGFAARGVAVATQLQDTVTIQLLDFLGNADTNESTRVPPFLKYNAFRWLRDTDFEPVRYAVSNLTGASSQQTKQGLIAYAKWERGYPRRDAVGILSFGQQKDPWAGCAKPVMLEPHFLALMYSAIYGAPLAGAALMFLCIRKKRKESNNGADPIR